MDFRQAWQRVGELAGETFHTSGGESFTYRFRKTYIVVSPGQHSIPRTNFEKVFRAMERDAMDGLPPVQGQKFIAAILARGAMPPRSA